MNKQEVLEAIEKAAKEKSTSLNLNGNKIAEIPPEIGQLTNLTTLYLYNNALTSLPPEIGQLTNLTTLSLYNNTLTSPPPAVVSQGIQAVLEYLRGIGETGGSRQWISKMLVVGQGGVGKTSLLRALHGGPIHEGEETTHG